MLFRLLFASLSATMAFAGYLRSQKPVPGISVTGVKWIVRPEARQILTKPSGKWSVLVGARLMGTYPSKRDALKAAKAIP